MPCWKSGFASVCCRCNFEEEGDSGAKRKYPEDSKWYQSSQGQLAEPGHECMSYAPTLPPSCPLPHIPFPMHGWGRKSGIVLRYFSRLVGRWSSSESKQEHSKTCMLHTWSLNAPGITQLEGKNECNISSSCLHSILPRNQQEKRDPCQIYKVLFSLKTFKEN